MRLANGERREWIKPIMFSGGLGSIEDVHVKKEEAEAGNDPTRRVWEMCLINAGAVFKDRSMSHAVAPLLLSIRNGSGEDRRAGVQNWCGRRSGLLCGGIQSSQIAVKLASCGSLGAFTLIFVLSGARGQFQRQRSECRAEGRRWDGAEDEPGSEGMSGEKRREPDLQHTWPGGRRKWWEMKSLFQD